jgi:hemolysin activation/secretion protein
VQLHVKHKKLMILFICLTYYLGIQVQSVYAQSITDADKQKALQELEKSIVEKQKLLDYEKDLRKQRALEVPKKQYSLHKMEKKVAREELVKFNVNKIILKGGSYLTRFEKGHLTEKYINTEMDQNKIYDLIRDITNYYIQRGFITARVYLPKQTVNTGTLTLGVDEGYIDDIIFKDSPNSFYQRLPLFTAFPNMKGKRLNLRDIEQGLDQLNRLSSNHAVMKLFPSKKQKGYSVVVIENKPTLPHHISLNYDNTNPVKVIPRQSTLSKDNLLALNDFWSFTYSQDHQGKKEYSSSLSGSLSIPFGYATFSANYSQFEYMNLIEGVFRNFTSSGKTENKTLKAETVLLRGENTKTTIDTSLLTKHTESFIEDAINEAGSRKLTIWGIGANQTWRGPLGVWSMGLHHQQGVPRIGATIDANDPDGTAPRAQFHKTIADFSVYKGLQLFGLPLSLRSSVRGQYSEQSLYSSERIAIGDQYTVRGFRKENIQGDIGGYIRNEVSTGFSNIALWPPLVDLAKKTNLHVYGALDAGYARAKGGKDANNGKGEGALVGAAIGVRHYGKNMTVILTYSKAIKAPDFINKSSHEVYFNVSFNLL